MVRTVLIDASLNILLPEINTVLLRLLRFAQEGFYYTNSNAVIMCTCPEHVSIIIKFQYYQFVFLMKKVIKVFITCISLIDFNYKLPSYHKQVYLANTH